MIKNKMKVGAADEDEDEDDVEDDVADFVKQGDDDLDNAKEYDEDVIKQKRKAINEQKFESKMQQKGGKKRRR